MLLSARVAAANGISRGGFVERPKTLGLARTGYSMPSARESRSSITPMDLPSSGRRERGGVPYSRREHFIPA